MSPDEYRDVVANALEALREVIVASECGHGVVVLNQAFASLDSTLKRLDSSPGTASDSKPAPADMRHEARTRWKRADPHIRERAAIEALGDGQRTVDELRVPIAKHLPGDWTGLNLHYSDVYTLLCKLMEAGEVDREPGEMVKGRRVWRYFRRTALSGSIAQIAEQLSSDEVNRPNVTESDG